MNYFKDAMDRLKDMQDKAAKDRNVGLVDNLDFVMGCLNEVAVTYQVDTGAAADVCPGCDKIFSPGRGAISRYRDMDICGDCGTREAFEGDFIKKRMPK